MHAHEHNADPEKIVVWGDSSGGLTAVLIGITTGLDVLDAGDYAEMKPHFKGIINWYGRLDQRVMLHKALIEASKEVDFYTVKGAQHGGTPFHAPSMTDKLDAFIRRVTRWSWVKEESFMERVTAARINRVIERWRVLRRVIHAIPCSRAYLMRQRLLERTDPCGAAA